MTTWTKRSAPPSISWTERTAPTTIDWLETFTMKKDTDNFYKGFFGINKGLVPTKSTTDNFYRLAGTLEGSGSFLLGKRMSNFIEAQPR